jgi:hypothetical protein
MDDLSAASLLGTIEDDDDDDDDDDSRVKGQPYGVSDFVLLPHGL